MLDKIIKNKKMLIIGGSGGVGKTTTSASLALQIAKTGKKVIVLTIDPAKRLANSLGLKELGDTPQKIDLGKLKLVQKGSLDAMMLDTKTTFDKLVVKHTKDQESAERILNNPLYKKLSSIIVGSQEYMAMEKLYELWEENNYDFIVVDTPPTVHAIDFLEAPQRMVNAIDKSMVKLLLRPANFVGRTGFRILETGSQMVLKVLDKIIGGHFLDQVSELVIAFQEMLAGFEKRAKTVYEFLQSNEVGFILVGACEKQSVEEVKVFSQKLTELKLSLLGVIVNRVHQDFDLVKENNDKFKKIDKKTLVKIDLLRKKYQTKLNDDQKYLKDIQTQLTLDHLLIKVPLFKKDIHDLNSLDQLGQIIISAL